MPRLPAITAVLALVAAATAQTYTLPLGATATGTTALGGALTFQVVANGPVTLTHLDFRLGGGTPVGPNAYVSIYLCTQGEAAARVGVTNTLIGTTVPVTATGALGQVVLAPIVPAAPFASVTLPSAHPFGITLVAHNCRLQTSSGMLGAGTTQLLTSGGAAFVSPPGTTAPGLPTTQRHLTGAILYTQTGSPMNLREMLPYGSGCGGLALAGSGTATAGQAISFTTTAPTSAQSVGFCMVAVESILSFDPTGLDLGIIGMPGCRLLTDLEQSVLGPISNNPAPPQTMTVAWTLPVGPSVRGTVVWAQSVWLDAGVNTFGASLSNGMRTRIW